MKNKEKKTMSISQKVVDFQTKKKKKKTNFFQDLKMEMKKVSWTSKDELKICTKIVLGAIFALGMGIYVIDLILRVTLQGMTNITHFIVR
ncbi:MAG: preprotein translocase subunit SecE [Simkaniaceae bacterium]|nr:preprotein translocase subunit SecE [Simkaniaceae bacterium]